LYSLSLTYLNCSSNQLTALLTLPNSLTNFYCGRNQLTTLPTLPNSLTDLYCDNNQLTALPTLPNGLKSLRCYENQLTVLPTLPNSLFDLSCYGNNIRCLPTLPNNLVRLTIDEVKVLCIPNRPISSGFYLRSNYPICNNTTIVINPTLATICTGSSNSITAKATSNNAMTIQWQRKSPTDATYTDIGTPTAYITNTDATYTTPPLSISDNGTLYRAAFTGCTGTIYSNPATVSVSTIGIAPPTVTNAKCVGGSDGGIVITPSGGTGPYTYLWSTGAKTKDLSGVQAGAYAVTVKDASMCPFELTNILVGTDRDIEKPTFTKPVDIAIVTNAACQYSADPALTGDVVDEKDNCSTGLNATYSDAVSDGTCEGSKIIKRTWTLKDRFGNTADDQVQTISVLDVTKPTFTRPVDKTIFTDATCDYNANPLVTGDVVDEKDNCSTGLNATYTDVVSDGTCEGSKIIKRTWSLVDKCGNKAADQVQTITVLDNIIPTFTRPTDKTIFTDASCGYNANLSVTGDVVDEKDNCSTGLNATYSDGVSNGAYQGSKIIKRTWSLVDKCGNKAADQVQTITVLDNTKPVVVCKNLSLDFTYGGSVLLKPEDVLQSVSDNCGSIKSLALDRNIPFNSGDVPGKTIVLTATDQAGNQSSCTATITVTRSELPHVICPDAKVINFEDLPSNGSVPSTTATTNFPEGLKSLTSIDKTYKMPCNAPNGTRPDGLPQDINFNADLAKGACKIVVRTFLAEFIGFSSSCSQVFYINSPDFANIIKPQDVTAACASGAPYIKPEDLANTDVRIKGTGYPLLSNGNPITDISLCLKSSYTDDPLSISVIIRTWSIKDDCGLELTTFTQKITISTCITPQIAISGEIKQETGETVVATVKAYNQTDIVNTMEGSFYSFPTLPMGESYRIRPERNADILNGVSTYDISLISKYILGLEVAKSPYQLIAMDVNRNGEVEAGDMLELRNLILRKITKFSNNTAWRFIPRSYVFKNPENPFAEDFPEILNFNKPTVNVNNADFIAVKIGDGNLSARTSNLSALQVRNAPETAFLELPDGVLEQGKEYRISVKSSIKSLVALQFALNIDKNAVTHFSIEKGDLAQFGESNVNIMGKKGIVTTAWSSPKSGSNDNTVFTVVLKTNKPISIREIISLNSEIMDNFGYNTEGGEQHLQLRFAGEKAANPVFELHQNRPNPFSNETVISFILPETNSTHLTIFDINGREIYSMNQVFNKGYNEITVPKSLIKTTGVYFYRLQSEKSVAVKRMQYFND
jgi:SprB repeat/Secretion system C-terminal sorting domain/Dockerin type I domain